MHWFRVASKFGLIIFGIVCAPYIKILAFLGAFLKPMQKFLYSGVSVQ